MKSMDNNQHNHQYQQWMQAALDLARRAMEIGEVPIGAIIVKNNEIIGQGYNRREVDHDPLGHAELMAIKQASHHLGAWRLSNCALFVTLEPCPMCAGAIVQARMSELIYAAHDPKAGYAGSLANILQDDRLNHQVKITTGILEQESSLLLKRFFRQLRQG